MCLEHLRQVFNEVLQTSVNYRAVQTHSVANCLPGGMPEDPMLRVYQRAFAFCAVASRRLWTTPLRFGISLSGSGKFRHEPSNSQLVEFVDIDLTIRFPKLFLLVRLFWF